MNCQYVNSPHISDQLGAEMGDKYCYVDLSSYEIWFAITCIDMNVILDLSTRIQQF